MCSCYGWWSFWVLQFPIITIFLSGFFRISLLISTFSSALFFDELCHIIPSSVKPVDVVGLLMAAKNSCGDSIDALDTAGAASTDNLVTVLLYWRRRPGQ